MTTMRLRHAALVNPSSPSFDRLPNGAEVSFLRMESVWPGEWKELCEVKRKADVIAGFTRFQNGDILVPKITPTFEAARSILVEGLRSGVGAGTTELHVVRPTEVIDPRFLLRLVQSYDFLRAGESEMYGVAGQKRVPDGVIRDLRIWLPGLAEQRRIAEFLDVETRRLDLILRARRKTLSLLVERYRVEIDQKIRGCDIGESSEVDFEPLGRLPRGWGYGRLKSVECEVQTGPFGSQLHADDYVKDAWPVVNPANIHASGLVADQAATVSDEVRNRLPIHILRQGDIVFARRGELGRAGLVREGQEGWLCGTGSIRVRFREGSFYSPYLEKFLSIPAIKYFFNKFSVGSTMANLNSSILLSMPLFIPPFSDQVSIVESCNEIEDSHCSLMDGVKAQIELLEERKRALITAAVTGQIDVTTARGADVS